MPPLAPPPPPPPPTPRFAKPPPAPPLALGALPSAPGAPSFVPGLLPAPPDPTTVVVPDVPLRPDAPMIACADAAVGAPATNPIHTLATASATARRRNGRPDGLARDDDASWPPTLCVRASSDATCSIPDARLRTTL
nr:hypothetical protein [Burkholderia paludis]